MANTVPFSLVSPERELFAGDVDSVLVPGAEGLFEVQAHHAPTMSTLSPGMLEIRQGSETTKFYVRGGFADVTAAGLTVLAELAVPEAELQGDVVATEKQLNEAVIADETADPDAQLSAQRALDILQA